MRRRQFLRTTSGVVSALLAMAVVGPEARAEEWNKAAFQAKDLEELVKVLGGAGAQESDQVSLIAPDIAENGAVVPIEVRSRLANTVAIAVLVEKNPNVLAAMFSIPQGTLPELQTRVKMAMTCNLYAIVRAQAGFCYAAKEIKVTLGGCGG
jgi:sulfur-oxidizing protein SoxY